MALLLTRILAALGTLLNMLGQVLGIVQQSAQERTQQSILNLCDTILAHLVDPHYGLNSIETHTEAVYSAVTSIAVPTESDVATAVWTYKTGLGQWDLGIALDYAGAYASWKFRDSGFPVAGFPHVRLVASGYYDEGANWPADIPVLDTATIRPADTILSWLQRSAPTLTWVHYSDVAPGYYRARSVTDSWNYFWSDISPLEFEHYRQMAARSVLSETLAASGITGENTYTLPNLAYRVSLTTIPSWAGSRTGTPSLYEVNSRVDQLGWCMFGNDWGWYPWQLLHWGEQLTLCQGATATRFHLRLRDGVVADLYALGPAA